MIMVKKTERSQMQFRGILLAGLMAALLFAARAAIGAETRRPPNVVFFIADDMSWADLTVYNPKSGIATPNIDRLVRDGLTFTHAFVASPSCAPSRGALLTGLTPPRNGAMFNHTAPDATVKKWPAYFREAGYETASFGKTAHGASVLDFGFDHASHYGQPFEARIPAAIEWLEKRKSDQPLCLLVGTNWPHTPWPPMSRYRPEQVALPPTQIDTPEMHAWRARYIEAVSIADEQLGQIYDAARRTLGDNTLFIFSSDHGAAFPFGKWNLYDDGIRVPLMMTWPGKIAPGAQSHAIVSWLDLLPTCLEAVSATPPRMGHGPGEISGQSFLAVMRGEKVEHRDRIFTTHSGDGVMNQYPIRGVRSRDWKYIRNLAPDTEHHTHIDKATNEHAGGYWPSWIEKAKSDPAAAAVVWRYSHRPAEELYDLRNDPWELKNLAADPAQADRLAAFRAELNANMIADGDRGLATEQARHPPDQPKKKKKA